MKMRRGREGGRDTGELGEETGEGESLIDLGVTMAQGSADGGAEPEAGVRGGAFDLKDTVDFGKLCRRRQLESQRGCRSWALHTGLGGGALAGVGPGVL